VVPRSRGITWRGSPTSAGSYPSTCGRGRIWAVPMRTNRFGELHPCPNCWRLSVPARRAVCVNPVSPEQIAALSAIHEGIVAFAREYRVTPDALRAAELPPGLAVEGFLRLVRNPTKEEAVRVGGLVHGDDFGTDRVRGLAQFRSGVWTAETLGEDFERAYWKSGMLNQPTPRGMPCERSGGSCNPDRPDG